MRADTNITNSGVEDFVPSKDIVPLKSLSYILQNKRAVFELEAPTLPGTENGKIPTDGDCLQLL